MEPTRYPVPETEAYLVAGFTSGFSLGYTGSRFALAPKNLKPALDNETHVTAAIIKELDRKHTTGPFLSPPIEPHALFPLGRSPEEGRIMAFNFRLIIPSRLLSKRIHFERGIFSNSKQI